MAAREPDLDVSALTRVRARSLMMFADDDLMTLSHAMEMFEALPDAELAVAPGTTHFLTQEKAGLVNAIVLDFLRHDPVQDIAPVRRAAGTG